MPRGVIAAVGIALVLVVAISACGSADLSESEIKQTIERVPLKYHYRAEHYSGDGAVVGGTATNGQATVTFEIVFGKPAIQDPIFPQDNRNHRIDEFERAVNDAGYTVTFDNAPNRRQARL
jgi:hypothetical protein